MQETQQELRVQYLGGGEDLLEKEMQLTSVFLPGKSHRQRSLEGYSPWGHKQSDMTEQLTCTHSNVYTKEKRRQALVVGFRWVSDML